MAEPRTITITQPRTIPGRHVEIAVSYQPKHQDGNPRGYYVAFGVYEITPERITRYPHISGDKRALLAEAIRFSQRQLESWAKNAHTHPAYQELAARFIPKPPSAVGGVAPSPEIPF